ncbi:MAG: hypothetical protein O2894_05875 [Planctomycetota bacterium]|nr:hypothetical protein [Planctomycetota bacterium]
MARVNHGNLFQHAIECAAAERLSAAGTGLRLVATHAMAPYEGVTGTARPDDERVLRELLGQVACLPPEGADAAPHAVMRAYARAGARVEHYPNTAELLAALVGRDQLSGVLCETRPEAVAALAQAWTGSPLRIVPGSWRDHLDELLPPSPAVTPWLFCMDPYTWRHQGERKREVLGGDLAPSDLEGLRPYLAAHVKGEQPGACLIFVYGLDPSHAGGFRRGVLALADRLGVARAVVGVAGPEGTRHLGAILASDADLPSLVAEAWDGMRSTLGLA